MLGLRLHGPVRRHAGAAGACAHHACVQRRLPMPALAPVLLLAVATALLLAGCASTAPSSFYTLTPLPQAEGRGGDVGAGSIAVGLGPVSFPQFLDRPQIVTRDGANRLLVNEFHRWGGTVQDDFLRVWGENLAYLLGTSRVALFPSESRLALDYRVPAQVLAFEGTAAGDAVLRVRWSVTDDRQRQRFAAREDAYRCPIAGGAGAGTAASDPAAAAVRYPAVVAALSDCLGDFSRDVAAVLGGLPKPQPPAAPGSLPPPPGPSPAR